MRAVLVDAGPIIAILDRDDRHHVACVAALKAIREPLVTVWPAVTEAMYLLAFSRERQSALWEMLETDVLRLLPLDRSDTPRMRALMQKYQDLPMDMADASLVRVAERDSIHRVFTLDRRHFAVYRPLGIKRFSFLP